MQYCPVCRNILQGTRCGSCGYEESLDFERYLSLGRVSSGVTPVSTLKQRQEEAKMRSLFEYWKQEYGNAADTRMNQLQQQVDRLNRENQILGERLELLEKQFQTAQLQTAQFQTAQPSFQQPPSQQLPSRQQDEITPHSAYHPENAHSASEQETAYSGRKSEITQAAAGRKNGNTQFAVGSEITFGEYPYSSDGRKGPITWKVLEVNYQTKMALMITKQVIDCMPYAAQSKDTDWSNCSLGSWLNQFFVPEAFGYSGNRLIPTEINVPGKNLLGFRTTTTVIQRAFLLSEEEVNYYLPAIHDRKAEPTPYALARGAKKDVSAGTCWWWLRSMGTADGKASYVTPYGLVSQNGLQTNADYVGVRPVVWIKINS